VLPVPPITQFCVCLSKQQYTKTGNCDTPHHVTVFITCSLIHLNFKEPPQQFAFYAEIEAFVVTAMESIKTKTLIVNGMPARRN